MRYIIILLINFLIIFNITFSQPLSLPFLDRKSIGAEEFILKNKDCDGRGIVIFILDSGVDPSVKGLTNTSEGKPKVIDMQDFTGQVEVPLNPAERDTLRGQPSLSYKNQRLEGSDNLELKPSDGKYFIGLLDENKYFKNSGVPDINNNGKKNDIFTILAYKVENAFIKPGESVWVFYIDEDLDGKIDDEKAMYDYKYRFDTFNFNTGEKGIKPLLSFSANISEDGLKFILNTCDNPHGTHCAGIAAGYQINGQSGFDGIAPGAFVVSLKIGNDVLSGGATTTGSMKKAYEYGVKFLKDAGFKYGVYSMSYGIGSETPGRSEIEKFLYNFAIEHPEIIIVESMGNSGPGINTSGNPSNNPNSLAAGATIHPETLKDLYGSARKADWITHFSSRGGCMAKPDVVAPGAAVSSVPAYVGGDAFWGTSMAAPETAGACAVLFSAALKNNIPVDGFMVRKAIKYSAKELDGYTTVDYGNGLVDINKAYEYLKILSKRQEYKKVSNYDITTENCFFPDSKGSSAYWNIGGFVPPSGEKQNVSVAPVFPKAISEKEKADFYRVFSLKSNSDWLNVDKSKVYIRGTQAASFGLLYDKSKLNKPGIYTARISAIPDNEENGGFADFDFQATVIIPNTFDNGNDYNYTANNKELKIGGFERIFVRIPPGASAMNVSMGPINGKPYNMSLYAYDSKGNRLFHSGWPSGKANDRININFNTDEVENNSGIWEIIPYSFYQNREDSYYNLNIKFYAIKSEPEEINEIDFSAGEKPTFEVKVFNSYNEPLSVSTSGEIKGFSKEEEYSQENKISYKKKFKVGSEINKVEFTIDMAADEFNKMTDIAVNVYNLDGKAILVSGMDRKNEIVTFNPPGPGEYEFEIEPAFLSDEIKSKEWKFTINEKYFYKEPITISSVSTDQLLYPQKWQNYNFKLSVAYPVAPDDYFSFGDLRFINKKNNDLIKKLDIYLEQ